MKNQWSKKKKNQKWIYTLVVRDLAPGFTYLNIVIIPFIAYKLNCCIVVRARALRSFLNKVDESVPKHYSTRFICPLFVILVLFSSPLPSLTTTANSSELTVFYSSTRYFKLLTFHWTRTCVCFSAIYDTRMYVYLIASAV